MPGSGKLLSTGNQLPEQANSSSVSKVLIVDDEPIVRDICSRVLARHNFTPLLATNGVEGLDLYRQQHREIALVISDVSMPLMDGIEFIRGVFELTPHSNVILMTGFNPGEAAAGDLQKLCVILAKPFSPPQLMEAVTRCLTDHRHEAESATA